ncbi:MAG TPA: BamA/TamA family outer membrane protein [Dongiaceae bacterium]|nr:BamA/TamA family outer membrane protein [Dongiaceae bacterium]
MSWRPGLLLLAALAAVGPANAAAEAGPETAAPAAATAAAPPAADEPAGFDMSEWLLDRKGFLPVPIVITEPAVGYGGGLAFLFFRDSLRAAAERKAAGRHATPPDIYGVAVAATENGTKFGGGGALLTFKDDRWRYRGAVGNADANLTFYGAGGDLGTGDDSIEFNLDGWVSSQEGLLRLGGTNHFVSARWVYLDLDSRFDDDQAEPVLTDEQRAVRDSGLGVSWEYDSRDTIFTPSRGRLASVESLFYEPAFGSENAFRTARAHLFAYVPAGKAIVVGLRADARAARGDVPFYQLPYIDLRGIPALRYQDDNVTVVEAELRWNVTPRWAAVAFAGAGRAWGRASWDAAGTPDTQGIGFRYLIASRLGMYTGIDYAVGPEEHAWYLQVGSGWR